MKGFGEIRLVTVLKVQKESCMQMPKLLDKMCLFHSAMPSQMALLYCPGFGWDRVNFPPSSCCVLDLVPEEC